MKIKKVIHWINILLILFFVSCNGQNKKESKSENQSIANIKGKEDELFKGKIFFAGDNLSQYTFIKTYNISKNDSLSYSIYKANNKNEFVFSIERLISNDDQEKFEILDILKFKDYSSSNTTVSFEQTTSENIVSLHEKGKVVKIWNFSRNKIENNNPNENYVTLLLYSYTKDGINNKNIISDKSKLIIESNISKYSHQEDFQQPSFFLRESKIIDNSISKQNIEVWKKCNEMLDFSNVLQEESLESDWRYPYKNIKSLDKIYELYKDTNYGDSFEGQTLPQQMALYMYFLPWKERKIIYEEIDNMKRELKKGN